MMLSRKILAGSVLALSVSFGSAAVAEETFVTIGTGGQTGVYYQVGGAICRLVNRGSADHEIKCTHTTGGSVANINAFAPVTWTWALLSLTGSTMPITAPLRTSSRTASSKASVLCSRCILSLSPLWRVPIPASTPLRI